MLSNTEQEMPQRIDEDLVEIDLKEYATLIWRKKWLIIGLVFIAVLASYFFSKSMTRIYETSTMVMVKEDSGMESLFADEFSPFGSSSKVSTYTALLTTRPVLNRVIEDLDLRDEEGELISSRSLSNQINISGSTDTNLITITVEYQDPEIARDIANKLVGTFQEENQDVNRSDLNSASTFINNQLVSVQNSLSEMEDRMLNFKMEEGIILPEEYAKNTMEQLTELESSRAEAHLTMAETELALNETKKRFNQEEREIVSSKTISNNPLVSTNRERLVELEVELAGLLEVYTEKHPQVMELKSRKTEVENVLADTVEEIITARNETLNPVYQELRESLIELETKLITTEARINGMEGVITELEKELAHLPEKELQLARIEREVRVAESLYIILMERREEIQIQEAMQSSDLIVVDSAVVNEEHIKPRTKLNVLIAAFLAAFIGVFIIFLLEYLDNTVKEEKDVEQLTGLPVLGIIPDMNLVDHSQGYGRVDK